MKISTLACAFAAGLMSLSVVGQNNRLQEVSRELQSLYPDLKASDVQSLNLDASHISNVSQVEHLYLNQTVNGIRIENSTINVAFSSDGQLVNVGGTPIQNVLAKAEAADPSISLVAAVQGITTKLGIQGATSVRQIDGNEYSIQVDGGSYTHSTKGELVYWYSPENELKLAWNFDLDLPDETHWYDFFVDAQTGDELNRIDWQVTCTHSGVHGQFEGCHHSDHAENNFVTKRTTLDGSVYNVFPFPVESPNHGNRDLLTEPALPSASPFGWHDVDGLPGAEYTITRGNNVYAYEDASDNNVPGQSADGGEELNFDFPLNLTNEPETYQLASITNLFYANNVVHDVLYANGFDEAAGNFQENNYGNGGDDSDEVRAEAQDGEAFNNANMATPGDGSSPRMQMYLWQTGVASGSFTVNTPSEIAGSYPASATATFGPPFPEEGLTGDLALAEDDDSPVNNACSELVNPDEIDGNIALLYRGGCNFIEKVLFAQEAGASAVIIINNIIGADPITPGGVSDEVEIPSMMISFEVGEILLAQVENGESVNVTLEASGGSTLKDGSFDNGIVIHEYVHGLSNRLTGGANNAGCLFGDEQMGEGWSDYYAIMLTMDLENENPVYRPMGTFASGEPTDGNGIRPVPYDTSFAVNAFTYASLPNQGLTVPHGVGFVWCTMLWDMTWDLIDQYGFDPDLINGTAGNNIALKLVTEGMKLQPCNPGFVDGRDAILLADELLYDGQNQCLIWNAFAKRGLGFSADQGNPGSRADGTAAFDVPPICQEVFDPPTASFSVSTETSCNGLVEFIDSSEDVPQSWLWDFGDGNTSEEQNPVHQYEEEGTYTVSLTVSNTLGEDESVQTDLIEFSAPNTPEAEGAQACAGDLVQLTSSSPDGNQIRWLNADLEQVGLGDAYEVLIGSDNESYFAQNYSELPATGFVGPQDNGFGTGGNHATEFIGTIIFEVFEPVVIESALVYSGDIGNRTIRLYEGASNEGTPIQSTTINVDFTGADRIDLGFEIDQPGVYSMGLNQADFYRNDAGANYPYEIGEVMSIIGSPAGPEFYYYFYDVEVSTLGCVSPPVEVVAEVTGEANFSFVDEELTVSFTDESVDATSWAWDFGDGETSTEQNPIHTYDGPGFYTVLLTVDGGCSITITIPVGVTSTDDLASAGFSIYPNPTADFVYLDNQRYADSRLTVRIHDIGGKEVLNTEINGERTTVSLSELNTGIYFLSVSKRAGGDILFRDKLTIVD